MTSAALAGDKTEMLFCGETFILLPEGALYWPAQETLVVADMHFEKGSSYARRGVFLPPYDTRATLAVLGQLIEACRPKRLVALGDSFHDRTAAERLSDDDRNKIVTLVSRCDEWVWVTGNHDPDTPQELGGIGCAVYRLKNLTLRHEPTGQPGELAGHLHPAAKIRRRGRSVRRPCFISDGRSLILPAMGALTGGLDIGDKAFDAVLQPGKRSVWMLGSRGVYQVQGNES
ncbi:ligase-associated DNA damage response endonuclease PdeM [Coralliovum pocilloporae]|uniref:ligase-associated DNA damage response endonuclease PdeM n=1 Tax=Coralliovum pocilloporae TaxID=3066369 RepID=UPI0033069E7F